MSAAQTPEELEMFVRDYILKEFLTPEDADDLTASTRLISDGILDSISALKLVAHLEEEFDVEFESHEVNADRLDTITQIVELVQTKL